MAEKFAFPWEHDAMSGYEMPEGLPLPDQMAYTALRNVYWSYSRKIISRDSAASEKRRIRSEYEKNIADWEFWGRLAKNQANTNRITESAKATYRKNRTLKNADLLVSVLDGLTKRTLIEEVKNEK